MAERYYSNEGRLDTVHASWKIIGVWILDEDGLTYHYFSKDAEAESRADDAIVRAKEYFGEKMGLDHLHYIIESGIGYVAILTEPQKTTDSVDAIIEKVKKLAKKKS